MVDSWAFSPTTASSMAARLAEWHVVCAMFVVCTAAAFEFAEPVLMDQSDLQIGWKGCTDTVFWILSVPARFWVQREATWM